MTRVVVVTAVGTGVGKTHAAVALVRAWGQLAPVAGYKPVESGVTDEQGEDERALEGESTFHVKPPLPHVRLRAPVSPHLAARQEGRAVDLGEIAHAVARARREASLVVELAGGLFSPLGDATTNADLLAALGPDVALLVAPDALGVLHSVRAVVEACRARRLPLAGVVLSAPAVPDASTGTNAAELALTSGLPVVAQLARLPVGDLVASGALGPLVRLCRGGDAREEPSF